MACTNEGETSERRTNAVWFWSRERMVPSGSPVLSVKATAWVACAMSAARMGAAYGAMRITAQTANDARNNVLRRSAAEPDLGLLLLADPVVAPDVPRKLLHRPVRRDGRPNGVVPAQFDEDVSVRRLPDDDEAQGLELLHDLLLLIGHEIPRSA